jgi:hypothetical protein
VHRRRDAVLAAAPKNAKTSRVDLPAPSALLALKIDTNESALDLNRTEALFGYLSLPDCRLSCLCPSIGGEFCAGAACRELGTRAIVKLIIELLARVYDLGTSDNLEYYAPLLSSKKGNPVIVDPERCPVPTSSRWRKLAASTILSRHP